MARPRPVPRSVHAAYVEHGPLGFYQQHGSTYRNPHEPIVHQLIQDVANAWPLDVSHVLDLAAGSGEVSLALESLPQGGRTFAGATRASSAECQAAGCLVPTNRLDAIDPFTASAYTARTGRRCEDMSFEQIAAGSLRGRDYSLVVCSFAMHLVERSRLPTLCWELAGVARQLLILTPHKRPVIDPAWGWGLANETVRERVRARLYLVQAGGKGLS